MTEEVTRTVLVRSDHLASLCSILTGYGRIVGIDHEGTITYELTGKDSFELGRQASEIQSELRAYDTGAEILSAAPTRRENDRNADAQRRRPASSGRGAR